MPGFLTTKQLGVTLPAPQRPIGRAPLPKGRHAPKRGYDTAEKAEWRDVLWEQMVRHLAPNVRSCVNVFLIDTTDALEIEKVLRLGFAEDRLHVCNANPAVVAVLKRRFPLITTYGVEADEALRRAHRNGVRFAAISLDLCGPISKRTHDILHAARAAVDFHGAVGLTLMRGREPDGITLDIPGSREDKASWRRAIRGLFRVRSQFDDCVRTESDVMRIGAPVFHLAFGDCYWAVNHKGRTVVDAAIDPGEDCAITVRGAGVYRSGVVTMMWLCCSVVQPISWRSSGWKARATDGWIDERRGSVSRRSDRSMGSPAPPMRV